MAQRQLFTDIGIPRRRVAPAQVAGESGVAAINGYIVTRERDPRLIGRTRYTTLSELLVNCDIVSASVRYFGDMIALSSWKVQPADESDEAKKAAEFVEHVMHDMTTPWHRVVKRAAYYKLWGFSIQEWIAKKRQDGKIGFMDVEPRAQKTIERWDVDSSGTVFGAVQRSEIDGRELYLPRSKLLYVVDDAEDASPEGTSLLRACARHAHILKEYERIEGFGYENDLQGMPKITAPLKQIRDGLESGRLTAAQATELLSPLTDFLEGHVKSPQRGLLLDSEPHRNRDAAESPSSIPQYSMDIVRADAGTTQAAMAAAVERKTRSIARILGTEFLLLGSDSVGSHALSEHKGTSFGLLLDAATIDVARTVEADLVHAIFLLNGMDETLEPTLVPDRARYRDVEKITRALRDLATAGAPLGVEDEATNEVRALLGLSRAVQQDIEEDAAIRIDDRVGDDEDDTVVGDDEPVEGSEPENEPARDK